MSARQRKARARRRREHVGGGTGRRLALAGGVVAGTSLAITGSAQADEYNVTNLNASGTGSLAQAIQNANATPGGGDVVFQSTLSGTIHLSSALQITDSVAIEGPGADRVTVTVDPGERIFYVGDFGGDLGGVPVSISGLTLAGANALYQPGGAIYNRDANLTISDSVIRDNKSPYSGNGGGGVSTKSGPLTIENTTMTGNQTTYGGAISSVTGEVTIRGSTLDHNLARYGGAIYVQDGDVPVTVANSTIAANTASKDGGAIKTGSGTGSTHPLAIRSSTITGNDGADTGGVSFGLAGGRALVKNSIITGNTGNGFHADLLSSGDLFDTSFSLIGMQGYYVHQTVPGSNLFGVDPKLGPLQDNGGPTQTMLPADTSPVIDQGSSLGPALDQRGLARPVDIPSITGSIATGADASDMGAVEVQSLSVPTPEPTPPAANTPTAPVPHKGRCKKKHKRSAESAKKRKCKKQKRR